MRLLIVIFLLSGCANVSKHTITSLQCLGFCSYAEVAKEVIVDKPTGLPIIIRKEVPETNDQP
jgi:uncharacterized protein YceK